MSQIVKKRLVTGQSKKRSWNHRYNGVLVLLVALAAAFRFWHIGWALPEIYEEAYPFFKAWDMWNWGKDGLDLNPHFFNYPGFTIYLNFILQGVHYVVGSMAGNFSSLDAFRQAFQNDPSVSLILSRIVQVVFDLGTVILLYQWGVLLKHRGVGIVAAVLAALNPLMIKQAHQVTVDTPLAFFVLAALYCMYRVALGDGMRWYMLAGLCVGLASASKYTGAMLLPVLLFGHYLNYEREKSLPARAKSWKLFFGAAGIAAGVFVLFNPFIFLSYGEFRAALNFEETHMAIGHLGIDKSTPTIEAYALDLIPGAFGWVTVICIAASVIVLLLLREKKIFLLLSFPLVYLAIIFTWQMRADRYLLPVVPVLLLVCSYGIVDGWTRLPFRINSDAIRYTAAGAWMMVMLFEPVKSTAAYHDALSLPDTRSTAKQWIEQNIERGSVLAMTPIGIRMFPDGMYRELILPFYPVDPGSVECYYHTRLYEDFDYVVGSDYDLARYKQDTLKYRVFIQFYREMRSKWKLIWEITPVQNQSGPAIWIFHPPAVGHDSAFSPGLVASFGEHPPYTSFLVVYLQKLTLRLLDKEAYVKAEMIARKRVEIAGENYITHQVLAQCLEGQGRNAEALIEAKAAIRLNPADPKSLAMLGEIYQKNGQPGEAEKALLEAIRVEPKFGQVYESLARMYKERKDLPRAADILSKYLSLLPAGSDDAKQVSAEIKDLTRLQ